MASWKIINGKKYIFRSVNPVQTQQVNKRCLGQISLINTSEAAMKIWYAKIINSNPLLVLRLIQKKQNCLTLSCLWGGVAPRLVISPTLGFLSCLSVSAPPRLVISPTLGCQCAQTPFEVVKFGGFLSCLSGSERPSLTFSLPQCFLSGLSESELCVGDVTSQYTFLICLSGSTRLPTSR